MFYFLSQLSSWVDKLKTELNLDEKSSLDTESIDAVLEKHRHQCESTLDQLLSTVREGEELSKRLLEESTLLRSRTEEEQAQSPASSHVAVEGFLDTLNNSKQQLEKLWLGKKQKLDYWIQIKNYERDLSHIIKNYTERTCSWESRKLGVDVTKSQIMLQKFTKECQEMDKGLKAVVTKGEDVLKILEECGVEVSITDEQAKKVDSISYMKNTLKSLGEQKHELLESREKIHQKLQQCVQLRRLEFDAKRVSGWIRHGENILQASLEAGSSLVEAEALLREYEQFQIAIEVSCSYSIFF